MMTMTSMAMARRDNEVADDGDSATGDDNDDDDNGNNDGAMDNGATGYDEDIDGDE